MNKQIEALKMAVEALDNACMKIEKWTKGGKWTAGKDALNACKEALESQERPNNTVVVPADKLKKMQEELKHLRAERKKWQGFAGRVTK